MITTKAIIRAIRVREGMTQKELAEAFGTDQSRISNMENGKSQITVDKLSEYCKRAGFVKIGFYTM